MASGIAPVAVVRLTTGDSEAVPMGRAEAGNEVMGSPRPSRGAVAGAAAAWEAEGSVGSEPCAGCAGADVEATALAAGDAWGAGCAAAA